MLSDIARILVLGSEGEITDTLREILDTQEFQLETTMSCNQGIGILNQHPHDVVLVDLGDEGLARIDFMKRVHATCPETSIILVTAHPSAASAIDAVRHGAHDYLVKPVQAQDLKRSVEQGAAKARRARRDKLLLARVRDLIPLIDQGEPADSPYRTVPTFPNGTNGVLAHEGRRLRNLTVDENRRRVRQNGQWISLTPTEFDLLTYLMRHAGEVQEYRKLVKEVQGYEADEWEARNLMKYYIHCLRKKLEPQPEEPQYILNVRGVGYLFSRKSAQPTVN